MKLIELKVIKEETVYKRIIDELKIKGLDTLYIRKNEIIDYMNIVIEVLNFLEANKNTIKKINQEQFENIVIILIDEILEKIEIEMTEEQIKNIKKLLKNSLLGKKVSKYLIDKFKIIYNNIKKFNCCKSKKDNTIAVQLEI